MWWERKGGDLALAVARQLNARGFPTELTVVGCGSIPSESLPNFVHVEGFLDKSTEDGRKTMEQLFAQSHFLILPSRADCTPLVIAEANAFGVPCLTSNVGGMAALVRDGSNGFKFPKEPNIGEYCDYVITMMGDRESYRRLAWSAFQEYQTRLNWAVAARATRDILADVVANIQHAP
jgi:glycosyltransferase involved in cell wall biosynthesis